MSQENVEVVREIYTEWERGNMAAVLPHVDPHVTFEAFMPDSQETVVVHGLAGLADYSRDWLSNWDEYRLIADEIRPVGPDNVFVAGRQAGTGRLSGAEVESPGFTVWTFRAGKVVRFLAHYDRQAALEAAGLTESAMSQENVEIVRSIYEAVARRDAESAFDLYAEDIVWDVSNARRAAMNPRQIYRGHEGVRQFWRDALSAFERIDLEVADLFEAGDQVVAAITEREIGRSSGVPVEARHFAVWTISGGEVTRMQIFDDRHEALEAAGISE